MSVRHAFALNVQTVKRSRLLPSKQLGPGVARSTGYKAIEASIGEIGLVEPLSVTVCDPQTGCHVILDGHLRFAAMVRLGFEFIPCLESADDETFTYNYRVTRLTASQRHHALAAAVNERGISVERLAASLGLDAQTLRAELNLYDGVDPEAAQLLAGRRFAREVTAVLRQMRPARQVQVVLMMINSGSLNPSYARALLYASKAEDLVAKKRRKPERGASAEQIDGLKQEALALQERHQDVEREYGRHLLDLMVVTAFAKTLFENKVVADYVRRYHLEVGTELAKLVSNSSNPMKAPA